MNRVVHLSRTDLDEDGLKYTAEAIAREQIKPYPKMLFDKLAIAYSNYQQHAIVKHFHGLRDYYSLIKTVTQELQKKDVDPGIIVKTAILRNFGGNSAATDQAMGLFHDELSKIEKKNSQTLFIRDLKGQPEVPVLDLISKNVRDIKARHLMLITHGDSAIDLLVNALPQGQRYEMMFGSRFEEDVTDEYNYRMLSGIILCMEQDVLLILRDFDRIYGALYDLLNQNYISVGKKLTARVALGAYSNPMCQVHNKFRCVVLIDEVDAHKVDPPFLNRFEKQLLRFSDQLSTDQKRVVEKLQEWVENICLIPGYDFQKSDLLMGFCSDTLPSVVLLHSHGTRQNSENQIECCKDSLTWIATPDAVLRASSSNTNLGIKEKQTLLAFQNEYFNKPIHSGFAPFLTECLHQGTGCSVFTDQSQIDTVGFKLVVYTHSTMHTKISDCIPKRYRATAEKLSSFKSERTLTAWVREFWHDPEPGFLILQCDPDIDSEHILFAKTVIDKHRREFNELHGTSKCHKHVLFIVHMCRISEKSTNLSWCFNFLSGWALVTIDSLSEAMPILPEMLNMSVLELFTISTDNELSVMHLLRSVVSLKHTGVKRGEDDLQALINFLSESPRLTDTMMKHFLGGLDRLDDLSIVSQPLDNKSWQCSVALDRSRLNSLTFRQALIDHVQHVIHTELTRIVYELESVSAFDCLIIPDQTDRGLVEEWCRLLGNRNIFNSNEIKMAVASDVLEVSEYVPNMKYPFCLTWVRQLEPLRPKFMDKIFEMKAVDDNVDEYGEITLCSLMDLVSEYASLFQWDLADLLVSEYFIENCMDFVDDICNNATINYHNTFSVSSRTMICKWFLNEKMELFDVVLRPVEFITKLILGVWAYDGLLNNVVLLLLKFKQVLKVDLVALINDKESFSIDFGADHHYETKMTGTSIVRLRPTPSTDQSAIEPDDQCLETNLAADNRAEECDSTTDDFDSVSQDDGRSGRCTETRLIKQICRELLPIEEVLKKLGGVRAWCDSVDLLLLLGGRVAKPPSLYLLRFCYDVAVDLIIPSNDKHLIFLTNIATSFLQHDDSGSFTTLFENIIESLEHLRDEGVREEDVEKLICRFVERCLQIDPDTDILNMMLNYSRLSSSARFYGPLIHRILSESMDDLKRSCIQLITTGDCEDKSQPLQDLERYIDDVDVTSHDTRYALCSLCCDIIEKSVFQVELGDTLDDFNEQDDISVSELVDLVNRALNRVDNHTESTLAYVAATAFVKWFLHGFSKFLLTHRGSIGDEYIILLHKINQMTINHTPSRTHLLKCLSFSHCCAHVIKLIEEVNQSTPNVYLFESLQWESSSSSVDVEFNPCLYAPHYNQIMAAYILYFEGNNTPMGEIIELAKTNPTYRLSMIAVLMSTHYYQRFERSLNDVEIEIGKWLIWKLLTFSSHYKYIISCLTGVSDFNCDLLRISQNSKRRDLQISSVILHVHAIVSSNSDMCNGSFLGRILTDIHYPEHCDVPPIPTGLKSFSRPIAITTELGSDGFSIMGCFCQRISLTLTSEGAHKECHFCCQPFRELNACRVDNQRDDIHTHGKGYTLLRNNDPVFPEISTDVGVRELGPITHCILNIIIHTTILLASMESKNAAQLRCLSRKIDTCWSSICTLVGSEMVDTLAVVNEVVKDCTVLFGNDASQAVESLESLVRRIDEKINSVLDLRYKEESKMNGFNTLRIDAKSAEGFMILDDPVASLQDTLFRYTPDKSFYDFNVSLLLDTVTNSHPLLREFYRTNAQLSLVKYLLPLITFHRLFVEVCSHRISESDTTVSFKSVVSQNILPQSSIQSLTSAHDEFIKAWRYICVHTEDLFPGVELPEINYNSKVCDFIITSDTSITMKVIKKLVQIQNDLLEFAAVSRLHTYMSNQYTPLTFLQVIDSHCVFDSIRLLDVTEKTIISVDTEYNRLLDISQVSHRTDEIRHVEYHFEKIERELANSLLLGKYYIVFDDSFPVFVSTDDLINVGTDLLNRVRTEIQQDKLNIETYNIVKRTFSDRMDLAVALLSDLIVLASVITKGSVDPSTTIEEYVRKWWKLHLTDNLLNLASRIRINQVCALYETVEYLVACQEFRNLNSKFMKPIEKSDEKFLRKIDSDMYTPLLTFLQIFSYRYLSKLTGSSRLEAMASKSLVPELQSKLVDDARLSEVLKTIPDGLCMKHIYNLIQLTDTKIQEMKSLAEPGRSLKPTKKTGRASRKNFNSAV